MPRRRPAQLRRDHRSGPTAVIHGVSLSTCHALDHLGDPSVNAHAVALALQQWVKVAARPRSELSAPNNDDTEFIGPVVRTDLERAIVALPRHRGRELHALVHPWDQRYLAKTLPNPYVPAHEPWWNRRAAE